MNIWRPTTAEREAYQDRRESYAEDLAGQADELMRQLLPHLKAALPLARKLDEIRAHGPAHRRTDKWADYSINRFRYACPDELVGIIEDFVDGDIDRARERNIQHFEAEYEE